MALQGRERELPWLCSFVESLSAQPIVLACPALCARWCHVWVLYPVPRGLSEVGLSVGAIHGIRRVKASLLCWVLTIMPRVGGVGGEERTTHLHSQSTGLRQTRGRTSCHRHLGQLRLQLRPLIPSAVVKNTDSTLYTKLKDKSSGESR